MAQQENSHGPRLREHVSVDVHHQVASSRVLHDETNMFRRLKAGEQVDQERVADAVHSLKNPLLTHQAEGQEGTERTQ